jgi:pilus assembly protein CpaB
MHRNVRTLIVLAVAIVVATIATSGVYRAIQRMPVREVEVAHSYVVVASHPLLMGARLSASDLKLVAWPSRTPVEGAHAKAEEIVSRGVIAPVLENEPVTEAKLAPLEAGAGLPPTIPPGMRAISVRVNEVIGVAGFVIPGTHVDVFVTLKRQNQSDSETRIVVSNVQVLTAGTRYDQEKAKSGEAMPSTVVTLLLSPQDAERTVLASSEGQVMLALRNPLDAALTSTTGTRTDGLFGAIARPVARPVAPRPVVAEAHLPVVAVPPPPPPQPYTVEAIRAAKRSNEQVY